MAATTKEGLYKAASKPAKKTAKGKVPDGYATVTYTGKEPVSVHNLRWRQNVKRKGNPEIVYHPTKTVRVMPVAEAARYKGLAGFTVTGAKAAKAPADDEEGDDEA